MSNSASVEKESFFQSETWKKWNGIFYSVGASVVIIGALFKIMHWPFAGAILTAGMLTEAFLFAIGAFDKPHKDYHWELVYPELDNGEAEAKAKKGAKLPALEVPAVSEQDVQKLSDNIRKLTDTAGQLSSFTSASGVTESYIKNISSASDAIGAFAGSQRSLTESSGVLVDSFKGFATNMSTVSNDSKQFADKIGALNVTLASVNSTYELQLKNVNTQVETFNAVNANLGKIGAVLDASVKETETYKEQAAKLAQQISSLNNVYGNMLSALNVR
ncbi:MAG: gliding motility protein GldL [Prevotellaceae bacterium]|jgi:gliding motility-associated protein GldL|nr:gliding motility protein GldL [Prevotellaceae bacterium]